MSRLLPTEREPEEISQTWADCLDRVYGGDSWRDLYRPDPQQNLWGLADTTRTPGVAGLSRIYRERLLEIFGKRLLDKTAKLRNSKKSVLFELIFCVGNPSGIRPAKRIAKHLLDKI